MKGSELIENTFWINENEMQVGNKIVKFPHTSANLDKKKKPQTTDIYGKSLQCTNQFIPSVIFASISQNQHGKFHATVNFKPTNQYDDTNELSGMSGTFETEEDAAR